MSSFPLLAPLILSAPKLSAFFLLNFAISLFAFILAFHLFRINKSLLVRPAYYCAIGWLLLYQVPLSIFSSEFFASLERAWAWALLIHVIGLSLLAWCVLVSVGSRASSQSLRLDFPSLGFAERWLPVGLLLSMAAVYFYVVPYDCTGLYALWADPWLTLLAREFSIKLIGSSPATYALGAVANIISPLVVLFSIFHAKKLFMHGRYVYFFMWIGIGIIAIILVLTGGAKGLLLPTLIMSAVASLLWERNWLVKGTMLVSAIALVASTMVLFELGRERDGIAGSRYNFSQCAVDTGTCAQSKALVHSLGYRDGSLGLSEHLIEQIGNRLSCMCDAQSDWGQCPTVSLPAYRSRGLSQTDRATTFFQAIVNRAFAVPFQVGSWHLMYSESEIVDGWKTLPFSRRFLGESLNMPELVYQKYGTIYSRGDKTSTSTAPTSFFLYYPAYLGWFGFLIAFCCLIAWDLIYAFFASRLGRDFLPVAAGIAAITSMNFMSSDFVTVLISHGGVMGLLIIITLVFLRSRPMLSVKSWVDSFRVRGK